MKTIPTPKPGAVGVPNARQAQAFTLSEMMVSTSIFTVMVLGIIFAMMFGMRYNELVCSKLGASDRSRMSFDLLTGEIRTAKMWRIGNGNEDYFNAIPNATLQKGNALQLWFSASNTNAYARYFFNTTNSTLCRWTNGVATYRILAQSLTNVSGNSMSFQAQDYRGSNISDLQYKYVIATTMEFCQYQYPLTRVGPGYYYNYYVIQFKTASHCPN
ncbi:MAG: prepilin-type N-terminal cleavage/methylation domain-containing protein [Verrucomicrobiota bacterium]